MITLYWMAGSCARVPLSALEEAEATYELRIVNRYTGDAESDAYRGINPKLKVPALAIDDWVVTENPVILTTLARRFPAAGLLPSGDKKLEVEAQSLMAWFASSLHPAVARQRFPSSGSAIEDCWDGIVSKARSDLETGFALLEKQLQQREWLLGNWSIVDVYMHWLWFRAVGSGMDPAPFPRCFEQVRECEQRPSVAHALDVEERVFAGYVREGIVPEWVPAHQAGRLPADLMA